MGKKAVINYTVVYKGEEVAVKRCTGCNKDKAFTEYSKGVALFGRQAKCKACNKEEYAAIKAAKEASKAETYEQIYNIRLIEGTNIDYEKEFYDFLGY